MLFLQHHVRTARGHPLRLQRLVSGVSLPLVLPSCAPVALVYFAELRTCRAAGLRENRALWFFSWRERAKRQFKDSTVEGKAERLPPSHVANPQADPVVGYRKPILVSVCVLSCIRGAIVHSSSSVRAATCLCLTSS
jgi:hypothetical protein